MESEGLRLCLGLDDGMERVQATRVRKRKAENQDNDRLSKRLSLLNLERNGQKLYVPVENPSAASPKPKTPPRQTQQDDTMQLDDTKHKVYIYDLDAELSDSESSDDGRLVFLPDIQKHLRESRIPPMIMANSDGELAGNNQLVLYNVPSSLTIPEEQDSVRKAIIESRARARAKQASEQSSSGTKPKIGTLDARDWFKSMVNGNTFQVSPPVDEAMDEEPSMPVSFPVSQETLGDDPDAMDIG